MSQLSCTHWKHHAMQVFEVYSERITVGSLANTECIVVDVQSALGNVTIVPQTDLGSSNERQANASVSTGGLNQGSLHIRVCRWQVRWCRLHVKASWFMY